MAAVPIGVWGVLSDILFLLATALVLGTIAERLGQSVIVGYLVAGTLVGPNVLGWISTQAELFRIAELGVALLLFTIGLEFSPRRLISLGGNILKTGPVQVVFTAILAFAVAFVCGIDVQEAVVVGMMVAVSSTACVMRLLTDRAEFDSEHGQTAVGILLIQDAAVIPMMLLVGVMTTGGTWGSIVGKLSLALVLAILLIGLFYILFNFIAPRLLLLPTWRRNRDLPVLLAVIMATGSAWATHAVGLSPALGSFAAGVILAVSPFAIQIRADIRPLHTLMVTLFFASIGMFGNPVWLLEHWALVAAVVLAIIVGKSLLIALIARAFRRPWRVAIAAALCLAQVGEFSFVLATIAQTSVDGTALMSSATFRTMVTATIVTLLFTPYLVAAAPKFGARCEAILLGKPLQQSPKRSDAERRILDESAEPSGAAKAPKTRDDISDLILIIGFGPAGQRVAERLRGPFQRQMVAIDLHAENIAVARQLGLEAHVGDATHRDILEQAGIYKACAVVITTPDHAAARHLIHLVRDLAPKAFIVARCRYHFLHWELLRAGAHEVADEEDQLGRRLAAQVRKLVGNAPDDNADKRPDG